MSSLTIVRLEFHCVCVLGTPGWSGKAGQKIFDQVPCQTLTDLNFDYATTPTSYCV
jgi:hypothetical protein